MEFSFYILFRIFMGAILLFIASAALIGGILKKPKPFFWNSRAHDILKTPTQYIIFGASFMLFSITIIVKALREAYGF